MNYISYSGAYSKERINFHDHKDYEIFIYTSGKGKTSIDGKFYEVEQGTIVVMPPKVIHGSISYDNLRYVAICGKCDELMHIDSPVMFKDNEQGEGLKLLQMIFANRYGNREYFNSLCFAFIYFVLKNVNVSNHIEKVVNNIKNQITACFYDSSINVTDLLKHSGYAEDYIRSHFKKIIGKTPIGFLTELRIRHAKTLINIYQNSMSLMEIATSCGFEDYIYFSRKFKLITGVSPQNFRKSILNDNK